MPLLRAHCPNFFGLPLVVRRRSSEIYYFARLEPHSRPTSEQCQVFVSVIGMYSQYPHEKATITGRLFMCKQTHARPIVVSSPSCSLYWGFIINKHISYIYILTSEQNYRGLSRSANGSIHIYNKYHRLMHAQSPFELYHRSLVGFLLT